MTCIACRTDDVCHSGTPDCTCHSIYLYVLIFVQYLGTSLTLLTSHARDQQARSEFALETMGWLAD